MVTTAFPPWRTTQSGMAEVLVQFDEPQRTATGQCYVPQVWSERGAGNLWEAWIEFHPLEGGPPVRTDCETEQLSRGDLRYWAAGLSRQYLQEALERAMERSGRFPRVASMIFANTAVPKDPEHVVLDTNTVAYAIPVVDPFVLYRHSGEYVLRQELRSLRAQQLRDIIAAFDIPDIDTSDFARTFEDALAERIVAGVQQSVVSSRSNYPSNRSTTEQV